MAGLNRFIAAVTNYLFTGAFPTQGLATEMHVLTQDLLILTMNDCSLRHGALLSWHDDH